MTITARGVSAVSNGNSGTSRNYLFISTTEKEENLNQLIKDSRAEKPVLNLNRKTKRGFMISLRPILA